MMLSILIFACRQEETYTFEKTTSAPKQQAEMADSTEDSVGETSNQDSLEETSDENSASETIDSDSHNCYRGAVTAVILESRAEFEALLSTAQHC